MISFLLALNTTFLIPWANARVEDDSETAPAEGERVQMTEMRASPDSDGCSKRVLKVSETKTTPLTACCRGKECDQVLYEGRIRQAWR